MFGGEWERIRGKFLLSEDDTYEAGSTGGEAEHTLTVVEMPKHSHTRGTMNITGHIYDIEPNRWNCGGAFLPTRYGNVYYSAGDALMDNGRYDSFDFDASQSWTGSTSEVGSNIPHNNMPPYLTVYMWKRIA